MNFLKAQDHYRFSKSQKESKTDLIQFERATAAAAPKNIEFYDLLKPLGYEIGKLYPNHIEIYETYTYVLEEYIGSNWIAINRKSKTFSEISNSIKFIKRPERRI